jgi:sulfotransferase family protein
MTAVDGGLPPERTGAQGPIFVVGSMRSGSTLLRLILDSHPDIAVSPETGFMGGLLAAKSIPNWRYGKEWYTRLDWTEAEVEERLRDFYSGMFRRYASSQGKRRWGEKTPFHTNHMAAMARVFPDAVFVGIVRHPGAVAASLRKSFHYSFPEALSYWEATNLAMLRAGTALGNRFAACRYEDIVLEGEPVLRELLDFLGEGWSPAVLEHHRVQRKKGAPRSADGSTITSDPIDAKRAESWTAALSTADYDALDATSELASFFGYEPAHGHIRHPLLLAGSSRTWVPTGEDLLSRKKAWSDRVDFERVPPSLVIDADPQELAERLAHVEQVLVRVRSRRSVRLSDALRKVQHGRSRDDLKGAWAVLRGKSQ